MLISMDTEANLLDSIIENSILVEFLSFHDFCIIFASMKFSFKALSSILVPVDCHLQNIS